MKFVIHGATGVTNFGDILFAQLFYEETLKSGNDANFFNWPRIGMGNHLANYLRITDRGSVFSFLKADAFVLMSGGYLGINPATGTAKNEMIKLLRYLLPAYLFRLTRRPLYIMGVGGGPLNTSLVRRMACRLMERARLVYVRDQETRDYFISYGVKRDIQVTSDTALLLAGKTEDYQKLSPAPDWNTPEGRILFFHLPYSKGEIRQFTEKTVPAINAFLRQHKEYGVAVGYDNALSDTMDTAQKTQVMSAFETDKVFDFVYKNPQNLCEMLMASDLIITPKLHVGIVGAAFSKSVLSFPIHAEKIPRFYRQIGEPGRCLPLQELTESAALQMLEAYHDRLITIPQELRMAAEKNLDFLKTGDKV